MHSRFRRCLAAAMLAVLALAAVSACSADPSPRQPPGALALVVGGRANMPQPVLPESLDSVVEEAILSKDTLYVVGVSGSPELLRTESMASNCNSNTACGFVVEDFQSVIADEVSGVRATTSEADTLEAIAKAARAVANSPGQKHIIVIDNGLQTTGELLLQRERALFADPAELAQALLTDRRLEPALKGVTITWVGLASHSGVQGVADPRPRELLKGIWERILTTAGAQVTFVGGLEDGPQAAPDLPSVTPIDVTDEPIEKTDPCPTIFDDQVGFVAEQDEFREPARARSALQPIAKGLIDGKRSARLVGYVAKPERQGPRPLSLRRAEAVLEVLVEFGVPRASLSPEGGGLAPEAKPDASVIDLVGYRRVEVIAEQC